MFTRHRLGPTNKLDRPHAMGTNAFSPQRAELFRHFPLLPSPSLVYHRRKPPNLRVSVGASAPQLQTLRLRIRSRAGACPPPAQRTAAGYAGRCAEVVEARSIATFNRRCRAFLAKAVLRFQHSKLSAVCGEAGGWPEPSQSFELTRVPRPSFAWAGPLSGRMLPYYWKDTCLLSPPRGPLRLDFYPLRLLPARVKGSGQECPLYTSQSSGWATNPRVTGFR